MTDKQKCAIIKISFLNNVGNSNIRSSKRMKDRMKILMVAGVLSLSTIGIAQFAFAEDQATEVTQEAGEDEEKAETAVASDSTADQSAEATSGETPTETVTEASAETPTETPTEAPTEAPIETEAPTESEIQTESDTQAESETTKKEKETEEKKNKIDEKAAQEYEEVTGESIYVFGSYPVGDITENTNEIYDYLRNVLGLNHAAACGVLANIQCESNFASSAVGDGGTSYGLCQWHLGRFSALINWCNANGYEYHSIQGQLGYLTTELQGGYASVYQYLLSVPDTAQGAYDAAYYWCKYFEIPANLEYNSQMRADLAMNLYYPKTLGTQKEEVEPEVTTLSDEQMEQVIVAAPKNISKLGRLNISKEETVNQTLMENGSAYISADTTTTHDKESLKEEAEKAVQKALEEYHRKTARETEAETEAVPEEATEMTAEDLALLENSFVKK